MPFPLIPILAALAAGGSLVPHAAGGMIVSGVGGYVAGTYLSTAAIAGLVATATVSFGGILAAVAGTARAAAGGASVAAAVGGAGGAAAVGGAGVIGTTLGATGATGVLLNASILAVTPIAVPIAVGAAVLGTGYVAHVVLRLRRKLKAANDGHEARFTEKEAKLIEAMIRRLPKPVE